MSTKAWGDLGEEGIGALRRAIELSSEHMLAGEGGPFGAVILRQGRIIAEGWNQVTSTPDPTAHAEMVAIRRAASFLGDFSLKGCVLYSSCEPCPMCLAGAYWARLDAIWFAASQEDAAATGFDDGWIGQELALPADRRFLPTRQALREEAQRVFQAWADKPDKTPY